MDMSKAMTSLCWQSSIYKGSAPLRPPSSSPEGERSHPDGRGHKSNRKIITWDNYIKERNLNNYHNYSKNLCCLKPNISGIIILIILISFLKNLVLSNDGGNNFSWSTIITKFTQIDALPSAKIQSALGNRNAE